MEIIRACDDWLLAIITEAQQRAGSLDALMQPLQSRLQLKHLCSVYEIKMLLNLGSIIVSSTMEWYEPAWRVCFYWKTLVSAQSRQQGRGVKPEPERKLPLACSRQNLKPQLSAEPELKAMPSDEYKNGLLSRGNATGGIRYATPDGRGKLQVRIGGRGRGLFASSTIEKSMLNVLYVSLCKKSFIWQPSRQKNGLHMAPAAYRRR